MKLSKSDFKEIVRECLLEILQEGVSGNVQRPRVTESREPVKRPQMNQVEAQRRRAIAEAVKVGSGGDPILSQLLADTARTTLPTMMESESRGPRQVAPDAISQLVDRATPDQIFGEEAVSKWADLAFATPKKRIE